MKTVGVISDTHIRPGGKRQIPARVWELFAGVDLILHAGDVNTLQVIHDLETLAPTFAVHGNNDDWEAMNQLPTSRRVPVEESHIGLVHGDRPREGVIVRATGYEGNSFAAAHALSHFGDEHVNCIIFGHSHRPLCLWHDVKGHKVLLLNPGSPTDKRYGPHYGCALLKVDGKQLEAEPVLW
jgi:putative phosphoesterase